MWICQTHGTPAKASCIQVVQTSLEEMHGVGSTYGGGAEPPKPLEAEAGETGHAVTDCVFSTGVWSYFVPICPHCAPTSPFWNGNIYSVHWKKEFVCFLFFILQGLLVGDVPESQKKIWTFKHWNDR